MRKNILKIAILFLLIAPVLSSCNTKKLEEEIATLKTEVATLTTEKATAEGKISELTAKVEELTKANEAVKAELENATAKKGKKK